MPQWDLADKMRKALRESDISVQAMAEYLDVSRNTVGTWINGRITPSTQTLRLWALRTGVPYGWLRDDDGAPTDREPDGPDYSSGTNRSDTEFYQDRCTEGDHLAPVLPLFERPVAA